tara:strand:+ start:830 stop:1591 length:762 start_codon:yes stop_codon:yes gene_type:complete
MSWLELDFSVPGTAVQVAVDALSKCETFMHAEHAKTRSFRVWLAYKACGLLTTLLTQESKPVQRSYNAISDFHMEIEAEIGRRSKESPTFTRDLLQYVAANNLQNKLNQSVELASRLEETLIPIPSFKKAVPRSIMAFFCKKAVRASNQTKSGLPVEDIEDWIKVDDAKVAFNMASQETPELGLLVMSRILNSNPAFMQIGHFGLAAMAAWYVEQFIIGDRDVKFLADAMFNLGTHQTRAVMEKKASSAVAAK